jgi:DNA-binding FadR family transcriptional regulator
MERISGDNIRRRYGTLTRHVHDTLKEGILGGNPAPGEKLPSEAQLIERFSVSRTVIREAIAHLREEGLVDPRRGAGVFVVKPAAAIGPVSGGIDASRISSVVEGLELRTAIEVEAAYLAAARCSPLQEEAIIRCHQEIGKRIRERKPTIDADLAFHLAIAEASNNRRFIEILKSLGAEMIPRAALEGPGAASPAYLERLHEEHRLIVKAITDRDQMAAREAMRAHLAGSQQRYRSYLNDDTNLS